MVPLRTEKFTRLTYTERHSITQTTAHLRPNIKVVHALTCFRCDSLVRHKIGCVAKIAKSETQSFLEADDPHLFEKQESVPFSHCFSIINPKNRRIGTVLLRMMPVRRENDFHGTNRHVLLELWEWI